MEIVCRSKAYREFKSPTLRQEQSRLNQAENVLKYIFVNGIAGVIAQRQYEPRSYANNYNVHGADGKFAKA